MFGIWICILVLACFSIQQVLTNFIWQTYTGNILIAVNPFTKLPHLYDVHMMEQYRGATFGELSPHVFAIADTAYRQVHVLFWLKQCRCLPCAILMSKLKKQSYD